MAPSLQFFQPEQGILAEDDECAAGWCAPHTAPCPATERGPRRLHQPSRTEFESVGLPELAIARAPSSDSHRQSGWRLELRHKISKRSVEDKRAERSQLCAPQDLPQCLECLQRENNNGEN